MAARMAGMPSACRNTDACPAAATPATASRSASCTGTKAGHATQQLLSATARPLTSVCPSLCTQHARQRGQTIARMLRHHSAGSQEPLPILCKQYLSSRLHIRGCLCFTSAAPHRGSQDAARVALRHQSQEGGGAEPALQPVRPLLRPASSRPPLRRRGSSCALQVTLAYMSSRSPQ